MGGILFSGHAGAAVPTPCPDKGSATLPAECYKEIRIVNNTGSKIWAVVEGNPIMQAAIGCDEGDVWLQRALGVTNKCLAVTHTYYIYVNALTGIAPGQTASVSLPWWSKRPAGADDEYIDWWRSGRILIFDDAKALGAIYDVVKSKSPLRFAAGSPQPKCQPGTSCTSLGIWPIPDKGLWDTYIPSQLNEYTFASVNPPSPNPDKNYELVNLNQNYNVSNVDQAYLPVAMEPIRPTADIGYMGTVIPLATFRANLKKFAGTDAAGDNPTKWPVYNNPVIKGEKVFPRAGIRVPSAETVFNFYLHPSYFGGALSDQKIPQLLPYSDTDRQPPKVVADLIAQWNDCLKDSPTNCPKSGKVDWSTYYKALNKTFLANYDKWLGYNAQGKCHKLDPWLEPKAGSNPQVPANKYALLRYIYGWVPFNAFCDEDILPELELPTVAQSRLPSNYIQQQYDYAIRPELPLADVFNPYTPMVHNKENDPDLPGLDSNAYAFSIDDLTAFQSNSGSGLIFAVGGSKGLPNKTRVVPTVPAPNQKWDIGVFLAEQGASNTYWTKYGICSAVPDREFPRVPTNQGFAIGVNPAVNNFPCVVSLKDSAGQTYKFTFGAETQTPPKPIWPAWPKGKAGYDTSVIKCETSSAKQWCQFVNETAIPSGEAGGPMYGLSTRGPLPN